MSAGVEKGTGLAVVTGAAGHVGGNLVRALLAAGRPVRAVVHEDTRALDGLEIERVRADLLQPASLEAAFAGAATVFHLAARIAISRGEAAAVRAVNVTGTRNVVAAARAAGVGRLVHFSSIHAFRQEPADETLDEGRPQVDPARALIYDSTKALAEREVLDGVARGLNAVILNPTAIIGPLDFKPSPMGEVIALLLKRKMPALIDAGFDWVDVRDVCAAALAAERNGRAGERYLLPGEWRPFRDLAGMACQAAGVRPPRWTSPMWAARLGAPFAVAWSRLRGSRPLYTPDSLLILRTSNRRVSGARAAAELGHRPRPLAETLADTARWWQSFLCNWGHPIPSPRPSPHE